MVVSPGQASQQQSQQQKPLPRKGRPDLKLSFEHMQVPPASSTMLSVDAAPVSNTFREQVGHIVSGTNSQLNVTPPTNPTQRMPSYGCGANDDDDEDDESFAAVYIRSQAKASQPPTLKRNRDFRIQRQGQPPQPPPLKIALSDVPSPSPSVSSTSSAADGSDNNSAITDIRPEDLETIKKLGEGAAGTVRQVLHKPTGLIMAKKSIASDPHPKVRKQILRELSFLKTCNSPYIVSFYGAFLEDGDATLTLCMEYCDGGSLEDIYKRARDLGGVIGEPVLERIAESVCKGLVYLHSKHMIHRDIKPSNIVVTKKGEIKLCDLGVSGELINSVAKTFTGTQYYMAPERIKGDDYAVQSDIWSLGLTLIEVSQNLPALPPPGQPYLSVIELLELIVRQPVPEIKGSHISEECRNFVAVCLTKDPKYRPGPSRMLQHPFIKMWEHAEIDLGAWVTELWSYRL